MHYAEATYHEPLTAVHMKAAAWIMTLVCRRGRTISQADKPVLLTLWSAGADFKLEEDAPARKTWISRAELAARVGGTLDAVIESLKRLARHGWIRRKGRGWELAWRIPFTERVGAEALDHAAGVQTPGPADAGASCLDQPSARGLEPPRPQYDRGLEPPGPRVQAPANQISQKSELSEETQNNLSPSRARVSTLESRAVRRDRAAMKGQASLFDADAVAPPPEPVECPADVVFNYLRARIVQTKFDLGIKPATGPRVLGKTERRNILARIEEHGGGEEGVQACMRVVDVDEADCRRGGVGCASWSYWNASTPFRNPANFEGRLGRWREDGQHAVFGVRGGSSPRRDLGFQPAMSDEDLAELDAATLIGYDR